MSSTFNRVQTQRLVELFGERKGVLKCESNTESAHKQRNAAWKEIMEILNTEGGNFAVQQVKKRWQNIQSSTKDQVVTLKR